MDNYIVEFKCKNCKSKNWLTIKKDETLSEHLKDNHSNCNNCDCKLE